jgi:hypothetical protein
MRRFALTFAAAALLLPSAALAGEVTPPREGSGHYSVETGEISLTDSASAGVARAGALAETELAASGCKRVWAARVYRNIVGIVMWKYLQQQAFCYNGSRITSLFDYRRWAHVAAPGWDFRGHIGRATTGAAGTWHYGTWTQGHFALCAAWCVEHKYPWVDIDVYGNGGWSHKTGGT